MTLPFASGIYSSLLNNIFYDFTLYHSYLPFFVENFIKEIFNLIENGTIFKTIFIISCFFIELIMILVFLEIIELNFCGLNENLKKYIEFRSSNELPPIEIKDFYRDEADDETDTFNNEKN